MTVIVNLLLVLLGVSVSVSAATFESYDGSPQSTVGNESFTELENESSNMVKEFDSLMELFIDQSTRNYGNKNVSELVDKGVKKLRGSKNQEGLDLLLEAWDTFPEGYKIGVIIGVIYFRNSDYENAIKIAKRLQSIQFPDNRSEIIGYQFEGVVHAYNRDKELSQRVFEQVLELRPGEPYASDKLAILALSERDFNKAVKLYQDVLHHNPNHKQSIVALSKIEIERGNFHQAEEILKEAIALNPNDEIFPILLAKNYFNSNQLSKVFEVTEPALKTFPNSSELLGLSGATYLSQNEPERAIKKLKTAVKLDSDNITHRYNLVLAYRSIRDYNLALNEIDQILSINAELPGIQYLKIKLLIENKKYQKAESLLETYSSQYPDTPEVFELHGLLLLANNNNPKAQAFFKKAINIRESETLYLNLAYSQMQAGQINQGFETLIQGEKTYPHSLNLKRSLGDSFFSQGQFKKAQQKYSEIIELRPNDVRALNNLAWLLMQDGKIDAAFKNASKAFKLAPTDSNISSTYAVILLKQGDYRKAQLMLNNLMMKDGVDPSLRYYWAESLVGIGENEKAKKVLESLLDSKANFNERIQAKQLLDSIN